MGVDPRRDTVKLAAFWAASLAVGCASHAGSQGGEGGVADGGCVAVDANATLVCVQPAPVYSADIAPLLDRDCNSASCHATGGPAWPLTDYSDVVAWSSSILSDVEGCTMPPADAGALPSGDKALLVNWVACGMPNAQ
jgi:hypothetical protein